MNYLVKKKEDMLEKKCSDCEIIKDIKEFYTKKLG